MKEIPIINTLKDQILNLCNPLKIILYNVKYDLSNNIKSFKLCIIVGNNVHVSQLEYSLYLNLECDNPFDILIYRQSEWEDLLNDDVSFASKISRSGVVLYELSL